MKALLIILLLAACTPAEKATITEEIQEVLPPQPKTIIAFGDSLTRGAGVAENESYPAQLQVLLREQTRVDHVVHNYGVNGETSAQALTRVPEVISQQPDIVIVETGVNDIRAGKPVAEVERNVEAIVTQLQAANITVVLASMDVAVNYGGFTVEVTGPYQEIALRTNATLIPSFLNGVLGDPALNLNDGVHPNAAGYRVIAEQNVLPVLLDEAHIK